MYIDESCIVDSWEAERDKRYIFPEVAERGRMGIRHIHPLKQRVAIKIQKSLEDDERVKSVIIFGSSVNMRCNIYSDIDVAVLLGENNRTNVCRNEVSEKIQLACGWNADVLWADRILPSEAIYEDIMKGVKII